MKKSEYDTQAEEFCKATGTDVDVYYTGKRKYFTDDTEERDVYSVTLSRNHGKSYTFTFGDSIDNTRKRAQNITGTWHKPRPYDVLACLTKYEPADNVYDFAAEYGYTKPSEALRVYNAVCEEWRGVSGLYNDGELEMLREIA